MGNDISLREAGIEDCGDLFKWRNHPEIRKYFFDSEEVGYDLHEKWFKEKIKDSGTKIYIAVKEDRKIGVIRFEFLNNDTVTVSVNLNPEYFYRGLGKKIIIAGTNKFISESAGKYRVLARMKKENTYSIGAFSKAGYRLNSEAENIVEYVFRKDFPGTEVN
jgi:RimJ/RimL family protein N-acetyltransferase